MQRYVQQARNMAARWNGMSELRRATDRASEALFYLIQRLSLPRHNVTIRTHEHLVAYSAWAHKVMSAPYLFTVVGGPLQQMAVRQVGQMTSADVRTLCNITSTLMTFGLGPQMLKSTNRSSSLELLSSISKSAVQVSVAVYSLVRLPDLNAMSQRYSLLGRRVMIPISLCCFVGMFIFLTLFC